MFIPGPRRTRQLIALYRAMSFLPCRRTGSKALRSLRRTSPAGRREMYTVGSLAVLGAPAEAGAPLQGCRHPARLPVCGAYLALPERRRGPQPRRVLGKARGTLHG